jgi:hypothetical protein
LALGTHVMVPNLLQPSLNLNPKVAKQDGEF